MQIRDHTGFLPLFSARTAQTAQGIRQDYPVPFRLFGQKISGKKLLCTAADVIFAKDKAQGADHPGGYPSPATQYFTNKRAAAAIGSLICAALRGGCSVSVVSLFRHRAFARCHLPQRGRLQWWRLRRIRSPARPAKSPRGAHGRRLPGRAAGGKSRWRGGPGARAKALRWR